MQCLTIEMLVVALIRSPNTVNQHIRVEIPRYNVLESQIVDFTFCGSWRLYSDEFVLRQLGLIRANKWG